MCSVVCSYYPIKTNGINTTGDYKSGKLPHNIDELTNYYRDYLDADGNVIEERRPYFELFVYIVERFFPSVISYASGYSKVVRKVVDLSEVFTASDEAWILLLFDNYRQRWLRMVENPESEDGMDTGDGVWAKGSHRKEDFFKAKYTSSQNGKKASGWNNEGVKQFNWYLGEVKKLRAGDSTGAALEAYLKDYWIGRQAGMEEEETITPEMQEVVEEAYTDLELFGV